MYKYSKKAEEKFFKDPCMAFFFIQFAVSQQARTQILSKYVKNGSSQDMEGVDGHPELEKEHKGADISERILQEIAQMKQEAAQMLKKTFIQRVDTLIQASVSTLSKL